MKDKLKSRIVNYYGMEVFLTTGFYFLAVDRDGRLYQYNSVPELEESEYGFDSENECCYITDVDLEGMNWDDTLVEYDDQGNVIDSHIMIGGARVPKPINSIDELIEGKEYYLPKLSSPELYQPIHNFKKGNNRVVSWYSQYLLKGILHNTKESAILHTKALIKISGGHV